ncbi:E3 ubiquitin-protein ligase TRIM52-like [Alligator mississippiensis]|uniref:E3 ubiquitin-protein ligase TRIM52-like n=1 Tax=Alligator mississippiensis TaxID=8496 RepID=UPI0028776FD5|nr:E3 ubiquitin-protein ligase TRIM52-like [Alligator mississippiensis]
MAEEATCSICLDLLKEPVTIDCGHNFCQVCITRYCEDHVDDSDEPVPCPSCRAEFQRGSFPLNTQLKNLVQKIKEQSVKPGKEQMENQCVEHEEKLKLFCEEDGNAICLICRESLAHHSHTVLPIQEAANNYQIHHKQGQGGDPRHLCDTGQAAVGVLCPVLGSATQEGCGQHREGPEEGHSHDQGAAGQALQG